VAVFLRPAVPLGDQLVTDPVGQPSHLRFAQSDVGHPHGGGGIGEGREAGGGGDDAFEDGRTDGVLIQAEGRAEGGKSPAGRRGSGRPVRPAAPRPRGR